MRFMDDYGLMTSPQADEAIKDLDIKLCFAIKIR